MKKYILLFVLSAATLLADEIPPYSAEFDALAEKPGCTGAQVFARPEWRKFFAAAKKDPKRFEYLLTRFSVSKPTQIHICNWENASQGVLAVMSAEIITGRSWMSYDGDDPEIKSAVKVAETRFPRHSPLKKLLANPKCCRELQNFFRRAYHGQKQPERPQTQNKIPAAVMKKAEEPPRSEYISREKALEIARKANMMNYDKSQEIRIYLAGGIYTIIFPIKLPPGALGPDYAAKIEIDAKSGKVISVMAGS